MGQIASQLCQPIQKSEPIEPQKEDTSVPETTTITKKKQMTYNDFDIIKTLGHGGFGDVYQVQKKTNKKQFAMKAIKKSKLQQEGMDIQMLTEKNVLLKSNHPFLVNLKYSFQSDKNLYLVMDLCQGGELFGYIQTFSRMGIAQEISQFIGAEVLLGLEYMHKSMKVIYRDLKPENILVTQEGHIKIADFGLAKNFNNENEKNYNLCGTLEYLAPEIIESLKPNFTGYGIEVDVWAFGVFLYELASGQPPFTHHTRNLEIIMKKIVANKVVYPQNFKEETKDIISKCLQSNPKDRPTWDQLKNHPFFSKIDWDKLFKQEIASPIKAHIPKRWQIKKEARPILESQTGKKYKNIQDFSYGEQSLANQL